MRFQKRFRYAEPFLSLPEAVAHLSVPVEEAACIDSILVSLRISFRSLDIDDEFRSEIENLLKTGIAVGITIGHHENLPDPVPAVAPRSLAPKHEPGLRNWLARRPKIYRTVQPKRFGRWIRLRNTSVNT